MTFLLHSMSAYPWRWLQRKSLKTTLLSKNANYVVLCFYLFTGSMVNGMHSPRSVNGGTPSPPSSMNSATSAGQEVPPACGARQLSKLKRFLTTLQQFGSDISPEIGERVRGLVMGLVVSDNTVNRPFPSPPPPPATHLKKVYRYVLPLRPDFQALLATPWDPHFINVQFLKILLLPAITNVWRFAFLKSQNQGSSVLKCKI